MNNSEFSYIDSFTNGQIIENVRSYFDFELTSCEYLEYDKKLINYLIMKNIIIDVRKQAKILRQYFETLQPICILLKLNRTTNRLCDIIGNIDYLVCREYEPYVYGRTILTSERKDFPDSYYTMKSDKHKQEFIKLFKQKYSYKHTDELEAMLRIIEKIKVKTG